ncbi:unnamed protein product [Prunus armeniaca]|uniref:Uncharacterized protein n=1 Tax=Prunus armeniaca TaxID=36596 RepID=A0A6J5TBT9_PRUAR|nr:unnamed protein product [Prunus armeniaca]
MYETVIATTYNNINRRVNLVESNRSSHNRNNIYTKKQRPPLKKDHNHNHDLNHNQTQGTATTSDDDDDKSNSKICGSSGPHKIEAPNLKSNLKKTATVEENRQLRAERRKVSWPDIAHGKDIAHVQEFEPSVWEDGDLEGVRNSCVCAIQ